MMFNNSSRIVPYSKLLRSILLPYSSKPLNLQDVDRKIQRTVNHIQSLTSRFPKKSTQSLRPKRVSLNAQITIASERLAQLKEAKTLILRMRVESAFKSPEKDKKHTVVVCKD